MPARTKNYLIPSSKNSRFASQTKTDGTNDAGLASSIGSNNHVEIWSRIHLSVFISPVTGNVNIKEYFLKTGGQSCSKFLPVKFLLSSRFWLIGGRTLH